MDWTQFQGVTTGRDTSDDPARPIFAEGMLLLPKGGFITPPVPVRLWDTQPLPALAGTLGVGPADRTCLIEVAHPSGHCVLVAFDFSSEVALGSHAIPASNVIEPVGSGAAYTVLWRGLAPGVRWTFHALRGKTILGNGIDRNLIYEHATRICRRAADQIRPLAPWGGPGGSGDTVGADASIIACGALWRALEPQFLPTVEYPYQRALGNYVKVSVGLLSAGTSFLSSIEGRGTAGDPFHYKVACPPGATAAGLHAFVQRDPNASGVVAIDPLASQEQRIVHFDSGTLRGGLTKFEERDVFPGPDCEIALTYWKRGEAGEGFETMPSPVVSVRDIGGQRLAITVRKDAHPLAGTYDAIRIYVGAPSTVTTPDRWEYQAEQWVRTEGQTSSIAAFTEKGLAGLRLALEVPNADGTYIIAPSMLSGQELADDHRPLPPAAAFVRSYQRVWMLGHVTRPLRVVYTGHASPEASTPEGGSPRNFIDLPASSPGERGTALVEYGGYVVALTNRTAHRISPEFAVSAAPLVAGPMNDRSIVSWTDRRMLYLGADFGLYVLELPNATAEAANAPYCTPLLPMVADYLRRFCDPDRADLWASTRADHRNHLWVIALRGRCGKMLEFHVHMPPGAAPELTGPMTAGAFFSADVLPDGSTVGTDLAGNLWWQAGTLPTDENDLLEDLGPVPLLAENDGTVRGWALDGRAVARLRVNQANRYVLDARLTTLRTGWIGGQDESRRTISEVTLNTWRHAAGLAFLTIENERGARVTRFMGELYGKTYHQRQVLLTGVSFQATLQILTGEGRRFAARSFSLEIKPTGKN